MGMQPIRARVRPTVTALEPADRRYATSGVGDALANAAGQALQDQQQRQQVRDTVADIDARIALRELEKKQQASKVAGMADLAARRNQLAAWQQQLEVKPGGAGYADEVAKRLQQEVEAFQSTLPNDPEVRQHFAVTLAEWESGTVARAQVFEASKRSEFLRDNAGAWLNETSNRLRSDPTPENFPAALKEAGTLIAGLEGMDGNAKLEVQREFASTLSLAMFDGLIGAGKREQAQALIDSGTFNGILDAKGMDRLRDQLRLESERAARAAERAKADAEREAGEQLDLIMAKAKDGVATEAELRAGEQLARQTGKPADRYDITKLRIENTTAQELRNASLPQIGTAIASVQQRIAKAGSKANPSDIIALQAMQDIRDKKRKEAGTQFKDMLAQGPQGRMAVLQQLDQYDEETRFAVANEAEAGLGYTALLGPALRPLAVEGREVRKQQPDLAPKTKIETQMRAATGRVGRRLRSEYGPTMETAADIYAAWAAQRGQTEFNAKVFDDIVSGVLGAQRRVDGKMQGGLGSYRGEKVLLPPHLTNAEFAATIAKSPFTNARYGNGKPADKSFIINSMVPELVDELDGGRTVYRFVDNTGSYLRNPQGGEYRLIVEKTR